MRLAVAATPQVAIPTLDYLLNNGHQLVKVFTTGDRQVGRGRTLTQSDVALWASDNQIECIKVDKATDLVTHLDDIDCVITIAFGLLLPAQVLTIPRHGFINLHFSLLPAWRGAAPVQRAIENGDEFLGITVFALDEGMDTGPIYAQASFAREAHIRSKEALEFLADKGVALIVQTLDDISRGVAPIEQSKVGVSLAKKLSKDEAVIDWSESPIVIDLKIAAFYPNPIAYTNFRNEVIKISQSKITLDSASDLSHAPGEWIVEKDRVLIGTGGAPLEIVSLIPQGKSEMKACDWARGARINVGERCG